MTRDGIPNSSETLSKRAFHGPSLISRNSAFC